MNAVAAIARLTWMRTLRSRTLWATAILVAVPLAVALVARFGGGHWGDVTELTLRALVLLAPVLHLAPVISDESDGKTYTYLWSRPVRREALLFGKLLAVAPALMVAAAASLLLAYLIAGAGPGDGPPLGRVMVGAVAGVLAASSYALGIGTLFPRHPLVAAMGYLVVAEQILPWVKSIQNVSTLYHVRSIWREGEVARGLIGLTILSAIWLAVAVWRVRRLELGSAEG